MTRDDVADALEWESLKPTLGKVIQWNLHMLATFLQHPDTKVRDAFGDEMAIFANVCAAALRVNDVNFFLHLVECMKVATWPPKNTASEAKSRFQAVVCWIYPTALTAAFYREWKTNPSPRDAEAVAKPDLEDIFKEMKRIKGIDKLVPGFKKSETDNLRKRVERALKARGLPFARKRQKAS